MKNQLISNKLREYMQQTGRSQSETARQINGCSNATISNILAGKWDGIADKMWNRVAAFIGIDTFVIIETNNMKTVLDLCEDAQEDSRFMAVLGVSGFGKSEALAQYAKTHSNVARVLCEIVARSSRPFLNKIAQALGIEVSGTPSEMLDAVCEHVNTLASPLLIFDDAGKLSENNIRLLQLIYDRTERRCGIVISATPYLKLFLQKGKSKSKMGFDEIYRRIELWKALVAPSREEVTAICKANGIQRAEIITSIYNTAKNFGSIRAMITNYQRLAQKGTVDLGEFTKQHTEAA